MLGVGLLLAVLAGSVAGQGDSALLRAFSRFLGTQDIQFDLVPDLYDGGYARISIFAKNANLGGMLVDEVWFKLVGITLDVRALEQEHIKILDYRGTAFHGRVSVQRLQEFFLASNAFKDIRLWSDGTSIYGEGTVPFNGLPIKIWLKGRFSVKGTKEINFHVDNMRINGFPLFSPIIRLMESQINPVMSQKDWPVNFPIRSLQMTTDGFILSSQADALAPCSICAWLGGTTSKP
ncbi:MAG: hypothetical protein AUI83_13015 [Armatimonadetes bacterium 13_1_40CM_3_65_7]|nr:MAG: hypothetical protein AUI83_13015 [Armatimonadetes bacterium 13_1_40CM_3_65_7]